MEHLENDMDDLFQKAGELYPLKTSESDWDTMLGKLNEEGFGDQKGAIKMNSGVLRNKRIWLSLLLLIPVSIGSMFYFSNSKSKTLSAIKNLQNQKSAGSVSTINEVRKSNEKNASVNAKLKKNKKREKPAKKIKNIE